MILQYDPLMAMPIAMQARYRLLKRINPPAEDPIGLDDVKLYLRISGNAEDVLLSLLIKTATATAEQWLRRSLITQTWKIAFDDVLPTHCLLPMGPVNTIAQITLFDEHNNAAVLDDSLYRLSASTEALHINQLLYASHIEVSYVAGYGGDASSVPEAIRAGILAHVAELYDNRGNTAIAIPKQSLALYAPLQVCRL